MVNDDDQVKSHRSDASRVGNLLILKGDVSGSEDLVIEGQVNGKIDLNGHDLTVQKGGKVDAQILARNIIIHGEVTGNITASEKVFISETGQMKGDIFAPRVSITDGAQFKGSIKMSRSGSS